jgi:hypothetical protein
MASEEEVFRYYIVYTYVSLMQWTECYEAVLDHPLDTYERIMNLAGIIAVTERREFVKIVDYKRIN